MRVSTSIDNIGKREYIDERMKEIDDKNSAAMLVIKYKGMYVSLFAAGNAYRERERSERYKKIKRLPEPANYIAF